MHIYPSAFPLAVLVIGAFSVGVGICVFCANTKRPSNQAFLIFSILLGVWLGCVFKQAITFGLGSPIDIERRMRWVRANAAVASIALWSVWLLKESVISTAPRLWSILASSIPWIAVGMIQVFIVYSDRFAFQFDIGNPIFIRGTPYVAYNIITILSCIFFTYQVFKQLRSQIGLRRVEMQFLTLTTLFSCSIIFLLNMIGNIFHQPILNRASIFIIFFSHGVTGWGIAFYRIFDARQILLSLAHRALILILISCGILSAWDALQAFVPTGIIIFVSATAFGAIGIWLHEVSFRMLDISGNKMLIRSRSMVIDLAKRETNPEVIVSNLEKLLCQQFHASTGILLTMRDGKYAGGGLSFPKKSSAFEALCACEWVTPGRIERQQTTKDLSPLVDLMTEHRFDLLVTIPRGSRTPSLIIALGEKTDGWVFTYPEIQRVQNLGELMDNILTHSRLASQAALKARMEHMAFMSRGLAHDLKNLITPVSSFLVYVHNNFRMNDLEADGYASARRSVSMMTDYVRQAMSFADELAPTLQTVDLSDLTRATFNACKERADSRHVTLASKVATDLGLVGDFVLLQRMLGNLINNAIDASSPGSVVTLSIFEQSEETLCLRISDHGTGIAPANLARIFEPYFTTKKLGDHSRGFGLGLTVAQKIAHLHHGVLTVDSELGRGTSVNVALPVSQPIAPTAAPERLEPTPLPVAP